MTGTNDRTDSVVRQPTIVEPALSPGSILGQTERLDEEIDSVQLTSGRILSNTFRAHLHEPAISVYHNSRTKLCVSGDCGCVLADLNSVVECFSCGRVTCPIHTVRGGCARCGDALCRRCSKEIRRQRFCRSCARKKRFAILVKSVLGLFFDMRGDD